MADDRWPIYDPGRDGPEFRRRSDYGYQRLEGRRPDLPPFRPHEGRGFWSQTRDEVQAWLGDPAAERRRRRDARLAGREREDPDWRDEDDIVWSPEHQAERPPDEQIGEALADQLADDPDLDAAEVRIDVRDGEVRLSGRVDDEDAARRAVRTAERLPGVVRVWNALDIGR